MAESTRGAAASGAAGDAPATLPPERAARTARALRHLAPAIAATSARVAERAEVAPVVAFAHAGVAGRDPGRPT